MPGPLPDGNARRRNAPTIPTTSLPAGGRKGRAPKVPGGYQLAKAGRDWWKWAWSTPQACAWDAGALYVIARRAQLEDELATLDTVEGIDLTELAAAASDQLADLVNEVLRLLQRRASGTTTVMREMRELDDRLGLSPKGMAALRWKIVADDAAKTKPAADSPPPSNVRRLRPRDPAAAAG